MVTASEKPTFGETHRSISDVAEGGAPPLAPSSKAGRGELARPALALVPRASLHLARYQLGTLPTAQTSMPRQATDGVPAAIELPPLRFLFFWQ